MQETSALYRQILSSDDHWFETRVVIGESGNLVTEGGEQILFGGTAIVVSRVGPDSGFEENVLFSVSTHSAMFDNEPEIGKAIAGEIDLTMLNPTGDIQRMGVVIPYVRAIGRVKKSTGAYVDRNGILTIPRGAAVNNGVLEFDSELGVSLRNGVVEFEANADETLTSEWLQQGTYFIDTREITHNDDGLDMLTIHGFDAMLKGEQDYATTNLNWPALDTDIVREIAGKMGVSVDPRTWDIMTDGYMLPLPTSYTLREMLGFIASAYVGCFVMTDVGTLRLVGMTELPPETNLLVDEFGYSIMFGEDRIKV